MGGLSQKVALVTYLICKAGRELSLEANWPEP